MADFFEKIHVAEQKPSYDDVVAAVAFAVASVVDVNAVVESNVADVHRRHRKKEVESRKPFVHHE